MIKYPYLKDGSVIGVTAPSSGVDKELHSILKKGCLPDGGSGKLSPIVPFSFRDAFLGDVLMSLDI